MDWMAFIPSNYVNSFKWFVLFSRHHLVLKWSCTY